MAATYVTLTQVPMVGVFSLADYINGVSLCTVLLTMVHVFMSKHFFKDASASRWFDYAALGIFVVGYIGCIVGMPQAATLR